MRARCQRCNSGPRVLKKHPFIQDGKPVYLMVCGSCIKALAEQVGVTELPKE